MKAILRTTQRDICQISGGKTLEKAAIEWSYVIQNRTRWVGSSDTSSKISDRAKQTLLKTLRVKKDDLTDIADADILEVSIPFIDDKTGWELRVFPWEYVLTAATKLSRGGRPLTVVRHLGDIKNQYASPQKITILESAPGRVRELYSFEAENKLVRAYFADSSESETEAPPPVDPEIKDPTYTELVKKIQKLSPEVLHVTGIDTHLAVTLFDDEEIEDLKRGQSGDVWDGFLLRGERRKLAAAGAEKLAEAINAAQVKPWLVAYNCGNSGARLAAMTVGQGARASIGFQSIFNDSLAESFYSHFYRELKSNGWNLLAAFTKAMDSIRGFQQNLQGTGIMLWSACSLVQQPSAGKQPEVTQYVHTSKVKRKAGSVQNLVDIDVQPFKDLNYSLIHNNRNLFKNFTFRKLCKGCLQDICIHVQFSTGGDSFPCRLSLDLDQPLTEISSQIRLPLSTELVRSVDENQPASLYVDVTHGGKILYRNTHRVMLMPTDQWRDDDQDRHWLPSFVLPRDPAVVQIIDLAQRYLSCLADNPVVGFDGYQCSDFSSEDMWEGVDLQVQAIWAALTLDHSIYYINPPPTYRESSQRLRTPSQILSGKRGTCIDLALLMASCLEYIEVYPVLFLLEGHAFPGYWRSDEAYTQFSQLKLLEIGHINSDQSSGQSGKYREPWLLGPETYREIRDHLANGNLVPLESVWLTQRSSFRDAYEAGLENLEYEKEFHSMIDVRLARQNSVTPLSPRYSG
ncbi:hypothetical protein [Gimesia algae]|uniref:Transglutaminase-like superfamily protein n=1 Tax=Gimesia algae TaxID=2527971 RepID=A0A517VBU0_9PLAN|nr:hypothetical protein [Gimesia algae]QDT90468.1 hypothetical protein Pan161_21200 [Gimesia algae]